MKQVAKDDLKRLFYRNETNFSLDKYITKMKQKFIQQSIRNCHMTLESAIGAD